MEKIIEINVITLGASGVGKTSIINRIKNGNFREAYEVTLITESFTIKRKYETKNLIISLNFRDTMGQERYQSLIPLQYIRNSAVVLLVFDSIETLEELMNRWYKFYKKNVNVNNSRFILVGNKSDIFGDKRELIIKSGEAFAEKINAHFITCSAKSADNMDNLERFIVTEAKRFIDELEIKLNYDIETLNSLKERWYTFYKAHANIENSKFILIGNKSDIFGNEKEEIIRQGQEFAEEIDAHFITCSAKSADNMDNVENFIISEAKRFIDEALEILREINNNKQINLNKKNANRNNDCNC